MGRKRKYFFHKFANTFLVLQSMYNRRKEIFLLLLFRPPKWANWFFNLVKGKILVNLHAGVFLDMEQLGF